MSWIITKYLVTAAVVVLISEIAKRSDRLGALIASLPMVTFLAMIWMFFEKQPDQKISNHAWYTFWYVLPTLPMFYFFPKLMPKFGFWGTMGASVIITILCFVIFAVVLRKFGIELM